MGHRAQATPNRVTLIQFASFCKPNRAALGTRPNRMHSRALPFLPVVSEATTHRAWSQFERLFYNPADSKRPTVSLHQRWYIGRH